MLENFFVNLKSKINLTKRNGNGDVGAGGSEKENNAPATTRQMLDDLLPNRKVRYTSVNQNDEFRESRMLPRVTHGDDYAWGPVDLAPREKFVEDMDNVIDKFIRVIRADSNETGALRNSNVIFAFRCVCTSHPIITYFIHSFYCFLNSPDSRVQDVLL